MKIAVTSKGAELGVRLDPDFGRCLQVVMIGYRGASKIEAVLKTAAGLVEMEAEA